MKHEHGYTVLELLIVVAMIGILASIAGPAYLDALHKGRQAATVADIRSAGQAWTSWKIDNHGTAPAARGVVGPVELVEWAALESALVPGYIHELPAADAWGHALEFRRSVDPAASVLVICSGGRDGPPAACPGPDLIAEPEPGDYDADAIWSNGVLSWRAGVGGTPRGTTGGGYAPPPEIQP